MIHPQYSQHSWFLLGVALLVLVVFALPMLVSPLWWAARFGWQLPGERRLTIYFGRCLGGVATAVAMTAIRAAPDPQQHRVVFELLMVAGFLMTAIHLHGAIRHIQPWLEDAETLMYAGLTALAWWLYRGLP